MLQRIRANLDVILVLLVAGVARSLGIDHTPLHDELYHVLAARSWVSDGGFSIGEGEYTRGWLYTSLVGVFFYFFGESLTVARIPSVIAGCLLAAVVYIWTRWSYGRGVAWLAALLLIFSPASIYISQYARFYSLHALLFACSAFTFHWLLVAGPDGRVSRFAAGLLAVVLLVVAFHLQITTLIGVSALAFWLLVFMTYKALSSEGSERRRWTLYLSVYLAVGILVLGTLLISGAFPWLWHKLNTASYWGQATDGALNLRYYHYLLIEEYTVLWILFPVAAVFALARRPGPTVFCLCVFLVTLAIHSLAAAKAARYFAYVIPFLAVIWASAAFVMYGYLRDNLVAAIGQEPARLKHWLGPRIQYSIAVVSIVGFVALTTPALSTAYRMMAWDDADWSAETRYRGAADWRAAADILKPVVERSDIVLTTSGVIALYYLGRYEIEINLSNMKESATGDEFGTDLRTGRLIISSPASLREIIDACPQGLIVAERRRWFSAPRLIPPETVDFVSANTEELALPADSRMVAFHWERAGSSAAAGCNRPEWTDISPDK